ncbi:hypothetical protein [Enterovibrio norvegicus]|nr:hypothetical protein [Enterovibrio norvegicus]
MLPVSVEKHSVALRVQIGTLSGHGSGINPIYALGQHHPVLLLGQACR